jgi:RNA polymerase sigma-70 factor, ECF subfamily
MAKRTTVVVTRHPHRGSARIPDPGDPRPAGPTVTPSAFETWYRAEHARLRQALCLAVGDAELGTEAADEAMTRTCERWDEVREYDNLMGWSYRVGLNWARSRQRRRGRIDRRAVPDREVLPVPGDPDLARALGGLSTDHRAIVVCRYHLDWSVEQTADALGIAPGTVKSRLARALTSLQRDLEHAR